MAHSSTNWDTFPSPRRADSCSSMALCDRLEAALTTADTTRARLLESLLHEALDPAAEAVTEAAE